MDKHTKGLYEKFRVERTDGASAPGMKHDGCRYFVLDVDHDPYALAALRVYADRCASEYPALARDLRALTARENIALSEEPDGGSDGLSPAARTRTRIQHYGRSDAEAFAADADRGAETGQDVPDTDPRGGDRRANRRQVGGSHYQHEDLPLEHWDIVALFRLDYFQGNITKYVMRCHKKGGLQDLEKAAHYLEKYIEEIRAKRIPEFEPQADEVEVD